MTIPEIAVEVYDFMMCDTRQLKMGLRQNIIEVFRLFEGTDPTPE